MKSHTAIAKTKTATAMTATTKTKTTATAMTATARMMMRTRTRTTRPARFARLRSRLRCLRYSRNSCMSFSATKTNSSEENSKPQRFGIPTITHIVVLLLGFKMEPQQTRPRKRNITGFAKELFLVFDSLVVSRLIFVLQRFFDFWFSLFLFPRISLGGFF